MIPLRFEDHHDDEDDLGADFDVVSGNDFGQFSAALSELGYFGIINPGLRFAYPGLSYSGLSALRH